MALDTPSDEKFNDKKTVFIDESTPHSPPSPDNYGELSSFKSICLVATCTAAMIINTANATSVSIALPTIGRDLHILEYKLQWLVSAYSLSSGCLLMFMGRIADLYGRKRVFLLGVLLWGAFSLGCAFAQDEITIDVLRALQGIGGAATIPAALGILAHAFPPSRARAIAFSTFAAGAPIGAAVGTVLGGLLTELTAQSWRSMFFLVTGLSAAVFAGGIFTIQPDKLNIDDNRQIDWIGALLITVGLVLIVFVLNDASVAPRGWKTGFTIALLVIGAVFIILFLVWQYYLEKIQERITDTKARTFWTTPPLMKLSIWSRSKGQMAVMLCIGFLEWSSFLSFAFWVQLYYQEFMHLSPIHTMIRLMPMFVTGLVCNVLVAIFIGRVPLVVLMVIGTLFTGVANLLFAVIDIRATYWAFGFPAAIVSVFGADFVTAAGSLFVAKINPPGEQSVAGALLQTMNQLGGAFGLAITTIIFNSVLQAGSHARGIHDVDSRHTSHAPRDAQEHAYKAAMWGGFVLGCIGAILSAVFLRGVGIIGHKPEPRVKPNKV
ncbi:hypothetical protein QCA50_006269 [Cerrena zonata]|uniref:Major facilitator superfamily (MFS) profile domain-containing protein n=1 Tax=Cerrena zonata TaxID=2478898 RepID=A0AAW0GEJ0_9APHY